MKAIVVHSTGYAVYLDQQLRNRESQQAMMIVDTSTVDSFGNIDGHEFEMVIWTKLPEGEPLPHWYEIFKRQMMLMLRKSPMIWIEL